MHHTPLNILGAILPGNILVTILLSLGGVITFGGVTVVQTAWLAVLFGLQASGVIESAGTGHLLLATLPHAVLELPGLWLAAAVGMRGGAIFRNYVFSQTTPTVTSVRRLTTTGLAALGLVLGAALIESFVTPAIIRGGW